MHFHSDFFLHFELKYIDTYLIFSNFHVILHLEVSTKAQTLNIYHEQIYELFYFISHFLFYT